MFTDPGTVSPSEGFFKVHIYITLNVIVLKVAQQLPLCVHVVWVRFFYFGNFAERTFFKKEMLRFFRHLFGHSLCAGQSAGQAALPP